VQAQSEVGSATTSVESATAAVSVQTTIVDSATVTVALDTTALATATTNVDNQTVKVAEDVTAVSEAQAAADSSLVTTVTNGVKATTYAYSGNTATPLPTEATTPLSTTTVPYVSASWGSGQVLNSGRVDNVIVKYEGTITVPEEAVAVKYAVYSDDGARLYIDGILAVNNWKDQGPTWSPYSPTYNTTTDKQQDFVLWYYEHGGGANVTLGWGITLANGSGYWTNPGTTAFSTVVTSKDPVLVAAAGVAQTTLTDDQTLLTSLTQVKEEAQLKLAADTETLTVETQTLVTLQSTLDTATATLATAETSLTMKTSEAQVAQEAVSQALQQADTLANTATQAVVVAVAKIGAYVAPTPPPAPQPEPVTPDPVIPDPVTPDPVTPDPGPSPEEPTTPDTLPDSGDTDVSDVVPDSTDASTDGASTDSPTEDTSQTTDPQPEEPDNTQTDGTEEVDPGTDTSTEPEPTTPDPVQENQSEESSSNTTTVEEAVSTILENLDPGEAVSAETLAAAGVEYKDLPPETPVDVRTDENGNPVIITADVAAALVLLENPAELIGAIFSDPGQALQAFASIGADMSPQEREEAQKMVVAAVIAGNAAINAVGTAAAAAGGSSSGGNRSGGGGGSSGGGGASGETKGVRRRKP
jgi:hypothetical protein